jgi:membrane-bound lytic murein transglycosylase D
VERTEYHLSIQEDFFDSFKIEETIEYKVKKGDNLGEIVDRFKTPIWLLKKFHPKQNLYSLRVGQVLKIPVVEDI